tara:strand:- start:1593 stop:1727 length:135 start_codon:yes stop_codon:yes gene_type:complete
VRRKIKMGEMSFYASEFDRKLDRCKCWADIICSECKVERSEEEQ